MMAAGANLTQPRPAETMDRVFTRIATVSATLMGRPLTFVLAAAACGVWGISGPVFGYSDTWQLVINTATTVLTFLAVFLIQNSQNRDAAAMQAKLDEILRSLDAARGAFIGIEHMSDVEIERIRAALEREVGLREDKQGTADDSVEQLLKRAKPVWPFRPGDRRSRISARPTPDAVAGARLSGARREPMLGTRLPDPVRRRLK